MRGSKRKGSRVMSWRVFCRLVREEHRRFFGRRGLGAGLSRDFGSLPGVFRKNNKVEREKNDG